MLGLALAEGEILGDSDALRLIDGDAEALALILGDADELGLILGDAEALGDMDGETLGLALRLADGDIEGLSDGEAELIVFLKTAPSAPHFTSGSVVKYQYISTLPEPVEMKHCVPPP